VDGPSIKNAKL